MITAFEKRVRRLEVSKCQIPLPPSERVVKKTQRTAGSLTSVFGNVTEQLIPGSTSRHLKEKGGERRRVRGGGERVGIRSFADFSVLG